MVRPLRADGPTGPRVAIARSEIAPEDTWLTCGLEVIETLLDYGYSRGIGQWRNSGAFGNFRYELTRED